MWGPPCLLFRRQCSPGAGPRRALLRAGPRKHCKCEGSRLIADEAGSGSPVPSLWHIPNPEPLEAGLGWFPDHGMSSIVPGEPSLVPAQRAEPPLPPVSKFLPGVPPLGWRYPRDVPRKKSCSRQPLPPTRPRGCQLSRLWRRQRPLHSNVERIWFSFVWKDIHFPNASAELRDDSNVAFPL